MLKTYPLLIHFLLGWAVLICLPGCEVKPGHDYFPLSKGEIYTYVMETALHDKDVSEETIVINAIGWETHTVNNLKETLFVKHNQYGSHSYILDDGEFISLIGNKQLYEYQPVFYAPDKIMRIIPNDTNSNDRWTIESKIQLLHTNPLYSAPDPREKSIEMQFSIIKRNQKIQTPHSTFEDCLVIKGEGEFSFFADPLIGHVDVPVTQTETYCHGVGLVKMVREEPLELEIFRGGRQTLLLRNISSD